MRSYAGMVENAMTHAEARAKQVGTALARDTAGQAQQALAQIERLREEAQAHTARAVGDLKSSFETVITQIGRQLEQMRGQFDNTSRGMRETAQQTASDLDSMRQEMQKRMEALPEQTAQATAAIRKALSEQLREIEAITPALTRAAAPPAAAADPYRQAPQRRRASGNSMPGPPPHFDPRGRQMSPPDGGDIGQVAGGLAQQLAGASYAPRGQGQHGRSVVRRRSALPRFGARPGLCGRRPGLRQPRQRRRCRLAASSVSTRSRGPSTTAPRPTSGSASGPESAACLDATSTTSTARRPSTRSPAATAARADFRMTVDRYIGDFERLLGEAEQSDPDGRMLQNYLTSESGRVYLLLAHASGRLR